MNDNEAVECVDLIIEKLLEWGVISPEQYGHMTENQRQELADLVAQKSEE